MTIRPWTWPGRAGVSLCIGVIRVYQKTLSPLLGPLCRFQPSCSRYTVEALQKYGLIKGLAKGAWRIARCNPFNPGGIDPP